MYNVFNMFKYKKGFIFIIAFVAILITINFAFPTYKLISPIDSTLKKRQNPGEGSADGGGSPAPPKCSGSGCCPNDDPNCAPQLSQPPSDASSSSTKTLGGGSGESAPKGKGKAPPSLTAASTQKNKSSSTSTSTSTQTNLPVKVAPAVPLPTDEAGPPAGSPPGPGDLENWIMVGMNSTLHCRDGIMRRQDGPDANCGIWF